MSNAKRRSINANSYRSLSSIMEKIQSPIKKRNIGGNQASSRDEVLDIFDDNKLSDHEEPEPLVDVNIVNTV